MISSIEEVASRLFAAMSENDIATVAGLYADEFQLWHSFDKQIRDRSTCLTMIETLGRVATRDYRQVESFARGDRVAQRYVLTLNAPGHWVDHQMDLAVFLTIVGGRITWMEEYIDSRDAADAIALVETLAHL